LPFGNTEGLQYWSEADWKFATDPTEPPAGFSAVVADLRAELAPEWQRMLADAALHGVPIYHSKQLMESLSGRVEIEHISENNLGALLPSSLYLRFKRVLDVGLVVVTLPLLLPLLAASALIVLVADGRPVFFRQARVGMGGRIFAVVKFRTMRNAANDDEVEAAHFTIDGDPRVTRLGAVLRRFRIDELPQIWNILRGEMSWIGPRPEALPLAEWYEEQIPFYSYRHIVRPGISGWAAVNQGNVAEIEEATAKLQYDFYYIKHFSLWLDLLITAKTVHTVLTGFGAR
jgi:lipopolysaccharide/colanic/teichoic acid biosynthesis glycosyltransferase